MLPYWVAIIAVFQSSCAVCKNDIVGNALSSAKRRPAPVRTSRSCPTILKYLPCSVDVYVCLLTWTRWFQRKTFPLQPATPIYIPNILPNISFMQTEENVKDKL